MAHQFNKGDSIFFLFKKGKTVQDSQRKPRFYLTRDKAEMYLPFGDEIVEYVPVRHGRWVFDAFTAKVGVPYRCSICKEEYNDTYNYCPNCGARMDGDGDATN